MRIVTLTTDLGLQDHYVAQLKGSLFSIDNPPAIVDISHNINHFDIVQAAYLFRSAWQAFPKGTIHIITVNDQPVSPVPYLLYQYRDHFFIAPDNGLFSLIFTEVKPPLFLLPVKSRVSSRRTIANAVQALIGGVSLEMIGDPAASWTRRITFQPVVTPSGIKGSVIYIDHYENAVVNIQKELFEQTGKGRPFKLYFKRHEPIRQLSNSYYEVPVGDPLCFFNDAGFLEVAINMGKASTLLGIQLEDSIHIEFD